MSSEKLKKELNQLSSEDIACDKVFCTTCGGKVAVANKKLLDGLGKTIEESMKDMRLGEFISLDEWAWYIFNRFPDLVFSICERELTLIDKSDARSIDRFIFYGREYFQGMNGYDQIIKKAIDVALKTKDGSLVETLIIVLGHELLKYEELKNVALSMKNKDVNVHRALYNKLRDIVPEVRDYEGDGSSFYKWW